MSKKGYGNVYEIQLSNNKYVYVCWIEECSFGIFNYISDDSAELGQLLPLGFKAYKACKEKAAKKKILKQIGYISHLTSHNITHTAGFHVCVENRLYDIETK